MVGSPSGFSESGHTRSGVTPPYNRAVMGGTFDRLHIAHQSLLRTAAHMAKEVFVGIVSDTLGKKLFPKKDYHELIQPYDVRQKNVFDYINPLCKHVEVDPLDDPWGPAPTDPNTDVIVVSYETEKNAHKINEMRQENGLGLLDLVIIPWIYVDGERISSTQLRKQEAESGK